WQSQSRSNIANILMQQRKYEEARKHYARSAELMQRHWGGIDHPEVAACQSDLANCLAHLGEWDEARITLDRSRRTATQFTRRILAGLTEAEQLTWLEEDRALRLQRALTFGLNRRDDPEMTAASAEWLANGKGTGLESLATRELLIRQASGAEPRPVAQRLREIRTRLAGVIRGDLPLAARAALVEEEEKLTKQLSALLRRPSLEANWTDVGTVRKALPRGSVFIDLARFDFTPLPPGGRGKEGERYAAWIVRPEAGTPIELIDLGEAQPIDEAIWKVREAMMVAPNVIAIRGAAEAERSVRERLRVLSKLLLDPMPDYVRKSKTWFISPDADLWLIPWCALIYDDGEY
ncbi:MAG: hypothetical protein C0506_17390, partial [Anaerolinea sp.]|nr:hypothetical protein [Anaerolinea sp.]